MMEMFNRKKLGLVNITKDGGFKFYPQTTNFEVLDDEFELSKD